MDNVPSNERRSRAHKDGAAPQRTDVCLNDTRHSTSGFRRRKNGGGFLQAAPFSRPTDIPVTFCTGAAREVSDHRMRLDEMGIHIGPKPFDIELLLMEINALLSKRHLTPVADGNA